LPVFHIIIKAENMSVLIAAAIGAIAQVNALRVMRRRARLSETRWSTRPVIDAGAEQSFSFVAASPIHPPSSFNTQKAPGLKPAGYMTIMENEIALIAPTIKTILPTRRRLRLIIKEADLKKLRANHMLSLGNVKVYENHGEFLSDINRAAGIDPAAGAEEEDNK
jgi:hypothetical protein